MCAVIENSVLECDRSYEELPHECSNSCAGLPYQIPGQIAMLASTALQRQQTLLSPASSIAVDTAVHRSTIVHHRATQHGWEMEDKQREL